ncbi:HAD_2 domain-containing protein [Cephalotus follicularis]|uniref:HAD_2 domain-containing protein n=1 Tax=Cephalotus follicularis TaxID=3775 RepID=A0A1Q3CX77_CEPFO|nr:HAD_2 domain-containing protein [Cephalotus follicularis]
MPLGFCSTLQKKKKNSKTPNNFLALFACFLQLLASFSSSLTMDFCSNSDSPFNALIFDLDDTLYPSTTGIAQAVKKNIEDFLVEKFGFPKDKASNLRVELFKAYGSTLAGLRALGHDISAEDYHSVVHGRLPYDSIKQDPQLRNLLRSIPQRKIILTNSDRIHAIKVLKRLGLEDCFDQIICFETMNPNLPRSNHPKEFPILLKPSLDAMKIALHVADVDPRRTLFFDDNVRNVAAGKTLGLRTVLVGKTVKSKEGDYVMETVHNLAQVIPQIWVSARDGGDQRIDRGNSELESLLTTTPVGA